MCIRDSILDDERIPLPIFLKQKRARFTYEPLGVVGVIAPWNYPWSIPFGEVAIALMAGNGVVLKPASLTPLIGQRIQEVFERAGVPEGLVRTVHGGGAVGQALVESTAAKIFFTGSVDVGRRVGEECARRLKGSVLELGGKDPMLVCADATIGSLPPSSSTEPFMRRANSSPTRRPTSTEPVKKILAVLAYTSACPTAAAPWTVRTRPSGTPARSKVSWMRWPISGVSEAGLSTTPLPANRAIATSPKGIAQG